MTKTIPTQCADCGETFNRPWFACFPVCDECMKLRVEEDGDCIDDLIIEFEGGI